MLLFSAELPPPESEPNLPDGARRRPDAETTPSEPMDDSDTASSETPEPSHVPTVSPEDNLPSYPRSEGRPTETGGIGGRIAIIVVILATIGLIAFALTRDDRPRDPDDALTVAVSAANRASSEVQTSSPASARAYFREEFGWRLGIPLFDTAGLTSAGIARIAQTIEVPALKYQGDDGRSVTVLILTYALLDQVPDRIALSREQYDQLADDPTPHVVRVRNADVAYWRDRGEIFVTVTEIPPNDLLTGMRIDR